MYLLLLARLSVHSHDERRRDRSTMCTPYEIR
eukprot:SAG11_NODE_4148_length_2041_cov_1.527806_3_plen_31_part_01